MILFVGACLISQPLSALKSRLLERRFWVIPIVYFAWAAATYFWDASGGYTTKEIERYAVLLFLPVALAAIPTLDYTSIRRACFTFVCVTVIVCVLCLVKAAFEYQVTHDYRVFFYQYLGEQMGLNAIFLSNYCLASITWILYYAYVEQRAKGIYRHVLNIGACVFLLMMILLLSSKLIIFLTLLILVIFILALGFLRGYFLKALLITGIVAAAGIFAVMNLHYLKWRFNTTQFKQYSGPQDDNNGIAIRLFMWETTADLIEERPVLGYGLKGGRTVLLSEYERKNFSLGVRGYYHSHNQYLESALMAGVPATVILLIMIGGALKRSISTRNFLLLLIVSHFMIQSLFEATFEVQHELVFYMFFLFLFYYHGPGSTKTINQHT